MRHLLLVTATVLVIGAVGTRELRAATITVTDPGGPSRPVNGNFLDTLTITTAGGGTETRKIITLRADVMNARTKATFLDDLISGRVPGQPAFKNVTSMVNGATVTVRANAAGLFITRIDIRTGAGKAAPEKDTIKFEPIEFTAPPALIFGGRLLSFNATGNPDNTILGTGGLATLTIGGPNGATDSVDTTDKTAIDALNALASGFSSTPFGPQVVGNELQFHNLTLDNSITFSGTDPTFQYGEFISAVPEPSTFVLMCLGAIGLLGYASRHRMAV
jgi:hypothetical protein